MGHTDKCPLRVVGEKMMSMLNEGHTRHKNLIHHRKLYQRGIHTLLRIFSQIRLLSRFQSAVCVGQETSLPTRSVPFPHCERSIQTTKARGGRVIKLKLNEFRKSFAS